MYKKEIEIRNELIGLSEEKYKKFSSALIPGVDNLLGVRIPTLRMIAKKLLNDDELDYITLSNDIYFEETMLKGLMIGNLKLDINDVLNYVKYFVPKISNWSVCDSFCNSLKIVRKNPEVTWSFLENYYKSDKVYDIRFAVVLMLFHFINDEYVDNVIKVCDGITNEDYYVKMAVAWCLSICYVKYPDKMNIYLRNNKLDNETFNKTIQKIRESLRVSKDVKDDLLMLKRK